MSLDRHIENLYSAMECGHQLRYAYKGMCLVCIFEKCAPAPNKNLGWITDDCGNYWPDVCPDCGSPMQVIRPGDCRCSNECDLK